MRGSIKTAAISTAFALILVAAAVPVQGATFSYDLDTVFSGFTPSGAAPWLNLTFTDTGQPSGTVEVTFSTLGLSTGEFVTEWDFNISTAFSSPTLKFVADSGTTTNVGQAVDINKIKADGDTVNLYDIGFDFPSKASERFLGGQTSVWLITCTSGCTDTLDASDFDFVNGLGTFHTAAHIQGIDKGAEGLTCSGWVRDGDGSPFPAPTDPCAVTTTGGQEITTGGQEITTGGQQIPEPASFLLIGAGLLGAAAASGIGRRRK